MIDLTIPTFLHQSERLTPERIHQLVSDERREWLMPDMTKYKIEEENVAKVDFLVVDRAAPVHVYAYPVGDDPKPWHVFSNTDDFENWYRPAKTRFCGQNTGIGVTDVLLDIPPGVARPTPDGAPSTGSPSRGATAPLSTSRPVKTSTERATGAVEREVSEGQRYIDSRHVALMVAAGLEDIGTWPMSFRYGKVTVNFEPPPPGRRWATTWSMPGATGRGVATLFRALGVK